MPAPMMDRSALLDLLDTRAPGFSLPQPFYTDPGLFECDMQAVFHRNWIFAAASCEVAQPGQYVTFSIGRTPLLVLRDQAGVLRSFYNSCRHRGSRLCDATHGTLRTLVCPYHRWTYKLDGRLAHAGFMPEDFDRDAFSLVPVQVREVGGTVYVCLADDPPDFDRFVASITPLLAPHQLGRAKVAFEYDLMEAGNWKLVMENSRECYHCRTQHPELMRTFLDIYDFANPSEHAAIHAFWDRCDARGLPRQIAEGPDHRATRLPFTDNAVSITMDGRPAVARTLGDVGDGDVGSLRWVHYPSVFNHALGDYAVLVRMLPVSPLQTVVTTKFLVDAEAVEGRDYDVQRLVEVWTATNDQDRMLVERNQAGVNSLGYRPGPYSPSLEAGVIKFTDWYCRQMADWAARAG